MIKQMFVRFVFCLENGMERKKQQRDITESCV